MYQTQIAYTYENNLSENDALNRLNDAHPDAVKITIVGETPPKNTSPGFYTALIFETVSEHNDYLAKAS